MNKIVFENGKEPAINAFNLNKIQGNVESAISEVATDLENTDNKFNFSTTEKVVGTWINGKPLYQKTLTGTISSVSSGNNINHEISNLETVVKVEGMAVYATSLFVPINFYNTESLRTYAFVSTTAIALWVKDNNFLNKPFYITIQYTKTTD